MSKHGANMPDNLAACKPFFARLTGATSASASGTLYSMAKKPPSPLQTVISERLKAVQAELGNTDTAMGKLVGRSRSVWSNWIGKANMPSEEDMIRLCDATHVTMEWLYRGRPGDMPVRLFIRLELRMAGVDPSSATQEQMEPVAARVAASASS